MPHLRTGVGRDRLRRRRRFLRAAAKGGGLFASLIRVVTGTPKASVARRLTPQPFNCWNLGVRDVVSADDDSSGSCSRGKGSPGGRTLSSPRVPRERLHTRVDETEAQRWQGQDRKTQAATGDEPRRLTVLERIAAIPRGLPSAGGRLGRRTAGLNLRRGPSSSGMPEPLTAWTIRISEPRC
jgi:hypothetical protein